MKFISNLFVTKITNQTRKEYELQLEKDFFSEFSQQRS